MSEAGPFLRSAGARGRRATPENFTSKWLGARKIAVMASCDLEAALLSAGSISNRDKTVLFFVAKSGRF